MLTAISLFLHISAVAYGVVGSEQVEAEITCASVKCAEGTECRIVYNPRDGVTRPSCEYLSDIPNNSGPERCDNVGGLPLLTLVKDGRKRKLRVFNRKGQDCPPPGIAHKNLCCYRAEKPGECPMPGDAGICVIECKSDSDCHMQEKCCPTGCGGRTCTDPVSTRLTCGTTKCAEGHECIDTPHGPECVLTHRPGICPLLECLPPENPTCRDRCMSDADCEPPKKCCIECDGCHSCIDSLPPVTCANALCLEGTTCIETPGGPTCVPNNLGVCPPVPCPPIFPPPACNDTCKADIDCMKDEKCCRGCGDCHICLKADVPGASCASILCLEGTTCIETPGGPTCVPNNLGVCPPVPCPPIFPPPACNDTCKADIDCMKDEKCCRGCGDCHICLKADVPGASCASILCVEGTTCIETPGGPTCVPKNPGVCPPVPCPPIFPPPACNDTCKADIDCMKDEKCCRGCGDCHICLKADVLGASCASIFCVVNTTCIETPSGPRCIPISRPGECPICLNEGESADPAVCLSACEDDSKCSGDLKCCRDCFGCHTCVKPVKKPSCDNMKCPPGQACVLQKVLCIREPCDPVPACVDSGRDICYLPPDPGPCKASIKMKYFDYNAQRCRVFYYGGCLGNANRFETWADCDKTCDFIKCPESASQLPEGGCKRKWNLCNVWGDDPKKCPVGQTCCKTPCGRRCLDVW